MSYATYDFSESVNRAGLQREQIARVIAAWGSGEGQGEDAGHYRWAEQGVTEWRGGFLCELRAGGFVYITGWCDYTGWGCQDGVEVVAFDALPDLATLPPPTEWTPGPPPADEWDMEPADLNRWLASGDD
jgi:hypothetical protein